jgi:hypothetical protein
MRPLTPEQWRALRRPSGLLPERLWKAVTAGASRLWIRKADVAAASEAAANSRSVLEAWRTGVFQRLSWLRGWAHAPRLLLATGLLVAVVGALVVVAFLGLPHTPAQESPLPSSAARTVLAGMGTATAPATEAPAVSPTSVGTPGSAPKLTLACVVHGATATLTIKNSGSSSFTWQAQPPPTLTVSPAQGALQAGQSVAVQVSAMNKKTASGTVTVIANHDKVSTEDKVACR